MSVAVIGAGGWGTALAVSLSRPREGTSSDVSQGRTGHTIALWVRDPVKAKSIDLLRENADYLPAVLIPPEIRIISDLEEAFREAEAFVIAVPAQHVREVLIRVVTAWQTVHGDASAPVAIINVAKGLELGSHRRMSEVIKEATPSSWHRGICTLSGPNHAEEVGRGLPAATVVGCEVKETAAYVQDLFMSPTLRVYTNPDLVGVEVSGALKNVIALAAGISDGLGFGDNAKAALMTRGIVEIARLGVALGARAETFAGLAGMGDLIVTCTSRHSRNARAGRAIGEGKTLDEALGSTRMVVEGVFTARAALELARQTGVEMPITETVCAILFEGLPPRQGVSRLMERERTHEDEAEHTRWRP